MEVWRKKVTFESCQSVSFRRRKNVSETIAKGDQEMAKVLQNATQCALQRKFCERGAAYLLEN